MDRAGGLTVTAVAAVVETGLVTGAIVLNPFINLNIYRRNLFAPIPYQI